MKTSQNGIDKIKLFEKFESKAYQDSVGVWTVGFGSIQFENGVPVKKGDVVSAKVADELLEHDVRRREVAILKLLNGIELNQNQFDAVVSFTYNEGIGALALSTLLKKLHVNPNDKTMLKVAELEDASVKNWCIDKGWKEINTIQYSFLVWNKITKDGKKVFLKGLIIRRQQEWLLYSKPIS